MSKRKLNRRQQWRIEKIQAEKAARADRKDKKLGQEYAASDLGEEQKGLVIAHYGQLLDIEPSEICEGETAILTASVFVIIAITRLVNYKHFPLKV